MSSRRENVPFDPDHFQKQERRGVRLPSEEKFRRIYRTNHWGGSGSKSGEGASTEQTAVLRRAIPALLERLGVAVLLDVPCGDYHWMRHVELPVSRYIGGDIVPEIVERNRERYGDDRRRFVTLDLTSDPLPEANLLLCRDGLVHLSFDDIRRALANIKESGSEYLLTTTFPDEETNQDITTGDWRVLNLQKAPFHFPEPLQLIDERCTEGGGQFRDKSLGLWRVDDLP